MSALGNQLDLILPPQLTNANALSISMGGLLENIVVGFADGAKYEICAISIERLERDITENESQGLPFIGRPAMIVVADITEWILTIAAQWMQGEGYFSRLRPMSSESRLVGQPELCLPEHFRRQSESELTHERGYLEGSKVCFGESGFVPICFMRPWRLRREIELDAMNGRPFFAEPGLVAVSKMSQDVLTTAVNELAKGDFFSRLRPIEQCTDPTEVL